MDRRSLEAKHAGPAAEDAREVDVPAEAEEASSVRRTLVRVIVVQAVALGLLWLLQARFHI